MKFSKFIVIPLIIAFLAFTIQIVDQLVFKLVPPEGNVGFGWIAFQAWAMYFLAGCTIKGGVRTFLGYVSGIVASILIMEFGAAFAGLGFFGFPVAVFLIVVPVICLERIPWFDFVPAVFVGAGVFFGFMSYVGGATYVKAGVTELIYCAIGLLYGVITVYLRTKYEAKVTETTAEETVSQ